TAAVRGGERGEVRPDPGQPRLRPRDPHRSRGGPEEVHPQPGTLLPAVRQLAGHRTVVRLRGHQPHPAGRAGTALLPGCPHAGSTEWDQMMHKKLPYWLVALLLVVVVAIVAVTYLAVTRLGRTTITATFPSAVGISKGTDVRILGVNVGSVDEVTPMGDTVEVKLHVRRGVEIPADAKAVQVTPSVIPDRNIQLIPAYSGGPVMESGAH